MDKAGDESVFRFTIKVPSSGDTIRTYFPPSVLYNGADPNTVDICREKSIFMESFPIDNCVFSTDDNMFEFPIPDRTGPGQYFIYELGYMVNPAYSQQLAGFTVQVIDRASVDADPTTTALYQNTNISLRVSAGVLTD